MNLKYNLLGVVKNQKVKIENYRKEMDNLKKKKNEEIDNIRSQAAAEIENLKIENEKKIAKKDEEIAELKRKLKEYEKQTKEEQ